MADNRVTITLASGRYDITRPLIDGVVDIEGIRLNVLSNFSSVDVIFRRMLNLEFDVSEFSLSHYLIARQMGKPLVALPIFLNRVFPHENLYCRVDGGVRRPSDLKGKKLGVPAYQVTRALWMRGILEDMYDVRKEDIRWVTEGDERIDLKPPPNVSVEKAPPGQNLPEMLIEGSVDAILWWSKPKSEKVRYVFEDPMAEAIDYYRKTRINPIMHTVVMRRDLYEQHPWIAHAILDAYEESKRICYEWRNHYSGGTLPWLGSTIAWHNKILGEDPFPFNLKDNIHIVETLARYSANDHMIQPIKNIQALFVAAD